MGFCSIKWCGKSSKTSNYQKDGITFHRFPTDPAIKSKWIDATHRGESWYPCKTSVICSRHFTVDSFHSMANQRRRLLNSAIPILFLPALAPLSSGIDEAIEDKERKPHDLNASCGCLRIGTSTSTTLVTDLTRRDINPAIAVSISEDVNFDAGTSKNQDYDSTLQDSKKLISFQQENSLVQTPTRTIKLSQFQDPDTPSAYDTPTEKRLCRRIIELQSVVKQKNVKLRKVRDANRRLKRQIISLKSRLGQLEKK